MTIIGVVFAFFSLELLFRLYHYVTDNKYFGLKPVRTTIVWQDDSVLGSRLIPNQKGWFVPHTKEYFTWIEVNSHGWPDVEHAFEKPEGTYRILFLGDSFVENTQVPLEKRFFRQVEARLRDSSARQVEVIATGQGNTGTAQQLVSLTNFGLKYKPDLVIQMFLTANDVRNNSQTLQNDPYQPYYKVDEQDQLMPLPPKMHKERRLSGAKEFLKQFRVVELLLTIRQKLMEREKTTAFGYPIEYHVYDQEYSEEYDNAWEITKKLILETKKQVEEAGAKYILVTLSNNEQVHSDVWSEALETYPQMKNVQFNLEKPDKILADFCLEQSITCFQMLPLYKEYVASHQNERTHNRYEGHWNQAGTDLAAAFLGEVIQKSLSESSSD